MIAAPPRRVVIEVPRLRTQLGLNARVHHMVRYRITNNEHAAVFGAMQRYQLYGGRYTELPKMPCSIRLVRVSPGARPPDSDNLAGLLKGTRDSVARYLGVDDADPRITWSVSSERGPWAVRIEIEGRG